jgi:pimeloyl-ACP methyl ester carboxylesterase
MATAPGRPTAPTPWPPFVYDLAQLIHQLGRDEVTLVGHSLGGNIAVRYTALYPERVRRLVTIEGLGLSPQAYQERAPSRSSSAGTLGSRPPAS